MCFEIRSNTNELVIYSPFCLSLSGGQIRCDGLIYDKVPITENGNVPWDGTVW